MENTKNRTTETTVPAAGRQLTLYFPCIGREITLEKNPISFGRGRFRDLDLSRLPEADYLEALEGEFYMGNGAWYFKPEKTLTPARLNDREVSVQHCRLNRGDCLVLGGRVVLIIRDFPAAQNAPDELRNNIPMFFESIHLQNGHLGSEVHFDADRRVIVSRSWGVVGKKQQDSTPRELSVPPHITTRKELFQFAREQMPGCRLDDQGGATSFGEDILLWLDRDCDVQYVAARGQVRHRQWMNIPGIPEAREQWYSFPNAPRNEEAIRSHVRRFWPQLPHNRKSALDTDYVVSGYTDPFRLNYHARNREVTCSKGFSDPVDRLQIPEHITERNELTWYLQIHRRNWMGRIYHDERMLRDSVLFKRDSVRGGKTVHEETRYLAEERSVISRKWDDGPQGNEYTQMIPLKIPFDIRTPEAMVQFVRKNHPDWLGEMPEWRMELP